jgi:hypothetical protein
MIPFWRQRWLKTQSFHGFCKCGDQKNPVKFIQFDFFVYSLRNNQLVNVSALGAALVVNKTLTQLKLMGFLCVPVFDSGSFIVWVVVFFCSLDGNRISDVSALAAALSTNTTLEKLKYECSFFEMQLTIELKTLVYSLSSNQISDIFVLETPLTVNTSLKLLSCVTSFLSFF